MKVLLTMGLLFITVNLSAQRIAPNESKTNLNIADSLSGPTETGINLIAQDSITNQNKGNFNKKNIVLTKKRSRKHLLLEVGLFASAVILNGLGDGLNSRTQYKAGHWCNGIALTELIVAPVFLKTDWKFPVTYTFIRFALFDYAYCAGANRNLNYMGGQNTYDQTLRKIPQPLIYAARAMGVAFVVFLNTKTKKHVGDLQ